MALNMELGRDVQDIGANYYIAFSPYGFNNVNNLNNKENGEMQQDYKKVV